MLRADAVNIADLQRAGKRRLPRIVYDFIEGGCEDEICIAANIASFSDFKLVPRYLRNISKRTQNQTLFGRSWALPFGIAPTGLAGLYWPDGDRHLACAARDAGIPFIQSGASTASIEDIAVVASDNAWYQLYHPRDVSIADDLVRRARDAGVQTLVITVDAQGGSNQERNIRNGFGQPLKLSTRTVLDALAHPAWLLDYLRNGMPIFADWKRYAGDGAGAAETARFVAAQGRAPLAWSDIERVRSQWRGNLVLKGLLHPGDAIKAVDCGVDGIIVSNHGGRKLDRAPAPIEILPMILDAVGDRVPIMIDGGIRRGSDVVLALCLGAAYCFVGRAALYGLAADGAKGVARAIKVLTTEVDLVMGQIGCAGVADLSPDFIFSYRRAATISQSALASLAQRKNP